MDSAADFEEAMLGLNPEYDMIFSKYNEACGRESPQPRESRVPYSPNKMKIIAKMNEIVGQKPIGELPTHSDWDDHDSVEKETIALMRKFGLQQSVDRPPDETRTISTIPTTEDMVVMRNGHKKMSIFLSDSFFALKPRVDPTFCTEDAPVVLEESTTSSTTEITDDTSSSSKISECTSSYASALSSENEASHVEYKQLSANDSTDLSQPVANLTWRQTSSTSSDSSSLKTKHQTQTSRKSSKTWGNKSRRPVSDNCTNWRSGSSNPAKPEKPKQAEEKENPVGSQVVKEGVKTVPVQEKADGNIKKAEVEPQLTNADEAVAKNAKVESEAISESAKETKNIEKDTNPQQKPEVKPKGISHCGSPLYKPKDLFLKKKAMMIQQVLSSNQP